MRSRLRPLVVWLASLALLGACAGEAPSGSGPDNVGTATVPDDPDAVSVVDVPRVDGVTTGDAYELGESELDTWQEVAPELEAVTVTSSIDGEEQDSLYLPPSGDDDEDQPLLVVVHSWGAGYLQALDVPYAAWADEAGWAMIHPDFRGPNTRPEATGSDLAVQDVVDAIDDAIDRGGVDPDRVYVTGYSGGGMMALLLAGREPDRIAAAAAWTPVEDLLDWYDYKTTAQEDDETYLEEIEASCGGVPTEDDDARAECERRSPSAHLADARDAEVPVYIGHGIDDTNVPASHAVRAFDALADEDDRLGADAVDALAEQQLPDELDGEVTAETGFTDDEYEVRFARSSGPVTLVLFDGGHDLVYHPGLAFLAGVDAER